jgi:hypothetical protein
MYLLDTTGNISNYTNLSMSDSMVATAEMYWINWNTTPIPVPGSYESFGKFIAITSDYGTPSIDTIMWTWLDSESASYDEDDFVLFKSNGTWTVLNDTPDTTNNMFSLSGLIGSGDYGILFSSDTCTYTTGSNWNINASDYCNITTDVDMAGYNFTLSGVGWVNLTGNITNFTKATIKGSTLSIRGGIFKAG